jgi:alkylated DNA repair protein alkB family protein 6
MVLRFNLFTTLVSPVIQPHEDGAAYHPVVATISLGSHAMFHYYKYQADPQQSTSEGAEARGQSIDSVPVHSILLEPRA